MTLGQKIQYSEKNKAWINFQFIGSLHNLILLYTTVGNMSDAMTFQRYFNQYIQKNNLKIDTDVEMGTLHRLNGNYDSSLFFPHRYTGKHPMVMWGKYQLALTYLDQKKLDKAETLLMQ